MLDLSNKEKLYHIYPVKKASGKKRIIHAPCLQLKAEQKKLASRLEAVPISDWCYGFRKGRSITDAASMHVNKDWIITIDIKDFFPSITKDMLCAFLSEYEAEVATYKNRLTQGSPCSPIISNIVFLELDNVFFEYFEVREISYSRYADDITISGMRSPKWEYVKYIDDKLKENEFRINKEKIKFMFKNGSQRVLGIKVNDGLSVDKRTRKILRAKIHQKNIDIADRGMLAFVKSVNEAQYWRLMGI